MSRLSLALSLALLLSACMSAPRPAATTGNAQVSVTASNFSDADPHAWGRHGPHRHPVHGIDLARFQTSVDWPTARANGVNFAFIKATEGGDILDPMFRDHWAGARRAGVPRGAYHFFYHCRPAAEQARWFIRNVPKESGALPPVLDMEWTPFSPTCTTRRDGATIRREAAEFMNILAAHYGQTPILYTTVDFFRENELWRLSGHEFWLRSVAGHPNEVYNGSAWHFWQYSGTGLVPGIDGKVDINVFAGSERDWANWLAARSL